MATSFRRPLQRSIAIAAAWFLLGAAAPADPGDAAIDAADAMLARIGWRLATANAPLCDRLAPTPGWMIHAVDQYLAQPLPQKTTINGFAAPVAVGLVVPGAAAEAAGVRADDAVVAIAEKPVPAPPAGPPSTVTRDAVQALVAAEPADRALRVTLLRDGRREERSIAASPGCRATFEVVPGRAMTADSDGTTVRIGVRFFSYGEAAAAAVVAHELAHIVLRHRARLEAAGVSWGVLSELGRNGRLFRRTEEEADLLGVALLRNAGWDPAAAPRFWREHGGAVDGGLFRSRTHPSSGARARALEAAIATMPADRQTLWRPAVLATRDQPLS
jgi:hypothetical protein